MRVPVDAPEIKANLAADDAGAIPTLGTGETRQISLINAENGQVPSLISYPARPIQAGKFDRGSKKTGLWFAEPKFNGRRALVHCPSGAMWNRHGGLLSIAGEFALPLRELRGWPVPGLSGPTARRWRGGTRSGAARS